MAQEQPGFLFSREASADLSAAQYLAMALDANGRLVVAGANEIIVGILQDKPAALGRAGSVMAYGISKVVAGEAINENDPVTTDAAGKAAISATTEKAFGVALDAVAAVDEVVTVLLKDFDAI